MFENNSTSNNSKENHLNQIKQIISSQSDEIQRIQEFSTNI